MTLFLLSGWAACVFLFPGRTYPLPVVSSRRCWWHSFQDSVRIYGDKAGTGGGLTAWLT
jgi:hypothetical protein